MTEPPLRMPHDTLHGRRVARERTPMQARNVDNCSLRAQHARQTVEMRRLMPQPVNENDLRLMPHALSV